ncbi:hypothetical protein [Kribbella sp. NPDC048915]|uniref:hypothetical protein n=1 Tax=Kribbella sp. NPDC048915 TaxID=3155148 RepID=UPI0034032BFF
MEQVAEDFDLIETAVGDWLRDAERDAGNRTRAVPVGDFYMNGTDDGLTTSAKGELAQLRQANRRLGGDVQIKRASPGSGPAWAVGQPAQWASVGSGPA